MSLPAILSQSGPISKRAIGTLPAVMVSIAIGALAPLDWLRVQAARGGRSWARGAAVALSAILVAGLAYTAIRTYRDYFIIWATDPDMFTHFEVGPTAIGQYADTLPPEELIYLSPVAADHPAIVYNSQKRPGIKGYNGRVCLVLPQEVQVDTTYVIVPGEDPNSLASLRSAFPQGEFVAEGPLHYNQPYFLAYQVPQDSTALVSPSHLLEATWGNQIRLLGYDVDAGTYRPGETIDLTLYFQALGRMENDYTVFVHLLGQDNPETGSSLWSQDDSEPCRSFYPTSTWTPGEIIRDRFRVVIPAGAPPADYRLIVGLYLLETMTRLPAVDAAGLAIPDDAALLAQVYVE
jgi:hypothetical protein